LLAVTNPATMTATKRPESRVMVNARYASPLDSPRVALLKSALLAFEN
jgi:hypothetical protein